jgi:ribosomal 50S subunit-associated protein YjgA (DUF615 family)
MRRKSERTFETDETEAQLRSRSDARRERLYSEENLLMLGEALVAASAPLLSKLDLPDGLSEAIVAAQRTREGAARNRALRLVRSALRDVDVEALREHLQTTHSVTISPAKLRKRDRPR